MNFLQRFHLQAYLLVFLSILGFTYADRNPALLFVSILVLLVSWWLVQTPNPLFIPRWVINLGVLFSSFALFWELVILQQDNLLIALGHFMIFLLLCKLFETKAHRDYALILTLSLLIIVAGSIFSASLLFGIILALYLSLGLYAILLFHLRAETDRARTRHPLNTLFFPEAGLKRDIRLVALGSGFVLLLFASVVFAVFPRDKGREIFGTWNFNAANTLTGFTDHVAFGDFTNLKQSSIPVMQVRIEQNGINIGNDIQQPYFRGMTLDFYDATSKQWLRSPRFLDANYLRPLSPEGELPLLEPTDFYPLTLTQTYTLLTPSGTNLFAIGEPGFLRSSQFPSVQYFLRDETLEMPTQPHSGLQYQIETYLRRRTGAPLPYPYRTRYGTVDSTGEFTTLPIPIPIHKKALAWAGSLLPHSGYPTIASNVRQIADRFQDQLRSSYPYSLETHQVDPTLDPTADFLQNRQSIGGHCEYFASAMVLLCTDVNISARMVIGYHGGDFNSVGDFYTVRQRHAHAWVEVYIPGEGWTTFDPSPASPNIDPPASYPFLSWIKEMFQSVDHSWLNSIATFDNSTRRYLADTILTPLAAIPLALKNSLTRYLTHFFALFLSPQVSLLRKILNALILLATISAAAWFYYLFHRRRTSPVRAMLKHLDRPTRTRLVGDLAFFDDFLRLLRRTKIKRQPHQTPGEYVTAVTLRHPQIRPEANWLVQLFYDIRFGSASVTGSTKHRITVTLTQLRKKIP